MAYYTTPVSSTSLSIGGAMHLLQTNSIPPTRSQQTSSTATSYYQQHIRRHDNDQSITSSHPSLVHPYPVSVDPLPSNSTSVSSSASTSTSASASAFATVPLSSSSTSTSSSISIVSPRSTLRRGSVSSSSSDDDTENDFLSSDIRSMISEEDAKLFDSLPKAGIAGRLRPRSKSSARFYYHINRCLDMMPNVLDALMRGLGPALILLAWGLFGTCAFVFFYSIVPVYGWSFGTWPGCVIIPYGLFLLFHVYYNHIFASFVSPGGRPKDWVVPDDIEERIRHEKETVVRGEGFTKYCKTCVHLKAPRMHHCHVCRTCVLRMDHHCPWIGRCVGFHNYRYFYNFLFWLEIGCFYLVACTLPLIVWPSEEEFIRMYEKHPQAYFLRHEGPIFFILVLTSAASIAVGFMLTLHTYLVFTNQTTIEMYHNAKKQKQAKRRGDDWYNIYDIGFRRNWLSIIGSLRGGWLIGGLFPTPLGCGRLDGNGTQFEFNPKMSKDYYSLTRGEVVVTV